MSFQTHVNPTALMTPKALLFSLLFVFSASFLTGQEVSDDLRKAQIILSKAQDADRLAAEAVENISSQRKRLEEDLMDANDNPDGASKEAKKAMSEKLKAYKREETDLLKKRKSTADNLQKVSQILEASPKKRAAFVADFERKNGVIEVLQNIDNQQVTTENSAPAADPAPKRSSVETAVKDENLTPSVITEGTTVADKKNKKEKKSKRQKPVESVENSAKEATTEVVLAAEKTEQSDKKVLEEDVEGNSEILKGNLSGKKQKARAPKKTKKKGEKSEQPLEETPVLTQNTEGGQTPEKNAKLTESTTDKPTFEVAATPLEVAEPSAADVSGSSEQTDIKTDSESKKGKKSRSRRERKDKNTASDSEEMASMKEASRITSVGNAANYKVYDLKNDVYFNPPAADCSIAFDGVDNFTGKKKRETSSYRLFAHTDDFMRAAMKDKDFVTCDIAATRIEGAKLIYLALTFTIQSKDAQKSFGFLDRGAFIIFRLINGKKLTFETSKTDIGIIDPEKGTTTYRAQLSLFDFVELTSSELDAVRVAWSAGYEDYEVYDLDVLKNMIKCLDKK